MWHKNTMTQGRERPRKNNTEELSQGLGSQALEMGDKFPSSTWEAVAWDRGRIEARHWRQWETAESFHYTQNA